MESCYFRTKKRGLGTEREDCREKVSRAFRSGRTGEGEDALATAGETPALPLAASIPRCLVGQAEARETGSESYPIIRMPRAQECVTIVPMLEIRHAEPRDRDSIWAILEPIIRAGDSYTLPGDFSREDSLAYWLSDNHEVFVAEDDGMILGTYFLRANQRGGGSHVANCGYVTAKQAMGRGVARCCRSSMRR